MQPGAVVCELSTVAPATVRGLTPLVAQKGATLIDTPVSGSVSVVESGTLTVMVGGDQAALDRARPVLEAFAKSIFHLGDVGAGATMKLVVNSLVHSLNVAVSEALVLAEKAGLDRETVYDIFEAGAAGAPYVKYKREAFLRPGEVPVAFSLDLVAKDQELIRDLAQQVGARMDQGEASRQLVAAALEAGMGERDISEVAEFLRQSLGGGAACLALTFAGDRRVRKAQDRRPSHADHPPDPVEAKGVAAAEKAPYPVTDQGAGNPEQDRHNPSVRLLAGYHDSREHADYCSKDDGPDDVERANSLKHANSSADQ